jgi:hypothetical protein
MLRLLIPVDDENLMQTTLANYHLTASTDMAEWYGRCIGPEQQCVWLALGAVQFFTPSGSEVTADEFRADVLSGSFQDAALREDLCAFVCGTLGCDAVPRSLHPAVVPAVASFLERAYNSE